MKRIMAAVLMAGAAGLAACEKAPADVGPNAETATTQTPGTTSAADPQSEPSAAAAGPVASTAAPIVEGAPSFAVLYPGGQIEAPATIASGAAGPGGLVAFRTDADPETVVAFYRARAEAAGLSSVMAMNMGEARSYGAAQADAGANLQVVASPVEGGKTSVQLSWSAGG